MKSVDNSITSRFNEIYDSTNKNVLSYIAAKCGNMEDISDILQETYMELYRTMLSKGADFVENDEAFVINIAKNKIYRHYTALEKSKSDLSLSVIVNEDDKSIFDEELEDRTLEDQLCTNELVDEIERFVSKKPQDIRRIFFLRFSLDMSIAEIASLMEISESSVKNKLYRTIKEIRSFYERKGEVK